MVTSTPAAMGIARGPESSAANARTHDTKTWDSAQGLLGKCAHWDAVLSLGMTVRVDIELISGAVTSVACEHFRTVLRAACELGD